MGENLHDPTEIIVGLCEGHVLQAAVETAIGEVHCLPEFTTHATHPHTSQGTVRVLGVEAEKLFARPAVAVATDESKKKKRLQKYKSIQKDYSTDY